MKLSLSLTSLLVLAAVLVCVVGDDIDAFKATLLSLCDANMDGVFGDCCRSNNNGQDIAEIRDLPDCFGTVVSHDGFVYDLFASNTMCLSPLNELASRSSFIKEKELTTIPAGAFSGLSSLETLQLRSVR